MQSRKVVQMNLLTRYLSARFSDTSHVHSRNTGGLKKVETFVNYIYKKSKGNLMVFDIQGIGIVLCDPEIATEDILDIDDKFLFCLGNLETMLFKHFLVFMNVMLTVRL